MNFHLGAKDARLEQGRYLRASIAVYGTWTDVRLDLNNHIGNNNGVLSWGGRDFSLEARDVRLDKGPNGGWAPVLHATLSDSRGVTRSSAIHLARCIGIEYFNLSCGISQAHLAQPVMNREGGVQYFRLPPQPRRGYC